MGRFVRRLLLSVFVLAWGIVVLYRDPRKLAESFRRLRHPPVDVMAVAELAASLPDDYEAVQRYVSDYVPHKPAWAVYGLPWYYPTVAEVLANKAGDCQARAILIASILEAKNMPYTMRYSFDHVWVDYPGKQVKTLEDPATSFVSDRGEGWAGVMPKKLPLREIARARIAYHWTPMPLSQKALLVGGVVAVVLVGRRLWR